MKARRRHGKIKQYLSDEQILEIWEVFKTTRKDLKSLFRQHGYTQVNHRRLNKLISKEEYLKYQTNTRKCMQHGYLYKRGSNYERRAKNELIKEGHMVIKSGGSKGIFDLWVLEKDKLRLIQVKADRGNVSFTKLKESLKLIDVPIFCSKELWIWRHKKGWEKHYL